MPQVPDKVADRLAAVILVLLCGLSLCAHAQEGRSQWVFVAVDSDAKVYFDSRQLSRRKNTVRVRVRYLYAPGKSFYSESFYLEEYDCAEKQIRILQFVAYNRDGDLAASSKKPSVWGHVIPNSIGKTIMGMVCKVRREDEK